MKSAPKRLFMASVLMGLSTLACAQNKEAAPEIPTSVRPPADAVDATGDAGAITERQSSFNLQRQSLNQEADLVQIQARIAEANARIAEAESRGKPNKRDNPLEGIDPTQLRVMLGLPPTGPIIPQNPSGRAVAPMSPADNAVPLLTSITGDVAVFSVMDTTVSTRPGDSINRRFKLASIDKQGATLKEPDGSTRRVMIEWVDHSKDDEEEESKKPGRYRAGLR